MRPVSEKEAKQMWCPFSRVVTADGQPAGNRIDKTGQAPLGTDCFASGCMAWRWSMTAGVVPTVGYCGLCGVPVLP